MGPARLLPIALLAGCSFLEGSSKDYETAGTSDDTSGQTDTDTESDLDCSERTPDPVPGPDCLSGTITCGQRIEGTTTGGSDIFTATTYETNYCFVPDDTYDGPERVYAFELAEGQVASIRLESPCANLDLVVLRWEDEGRCPSEDHIAGECDAAVGWAGGTVEDLWGYTTSRYLLVVDGHDDVEANFALSVTCE